MTLVLRVLLAIIGIVIIWLGLNISLGGIPTLGWQGPTDFFTVTDQTAFLIQDNHFRFVGGVWLGVGVFFAFGAIFLHRLSGILTAMVFLVFIGGLARLSASDPEVLLSAKILPSLIAELIVFPSIGLWIHRSVDGENTV